ncbi:hypothetical protein ALQ55_200347 [Pseudomonas savastanoi pv. savastanoi]|nr:hypothetical protein ALQ55_200347 [Pseudomonas savastanoi pv. savastanoi]
MIAGRCHFDCRSLQIDRCHVVARGSSTANDRFLALQVLIAGTDAQVDPGNIESRHKHGLFRYTHRAMAYQLWLYGYNSKPIEPSWKEPPF